MRYNTTLASRAGGSPQGAAITEPPPAPPTPALAVNQTTATLPAASSPPPYQGRADLPVSQPVASPARTLKKISFAKPAKKEETKTAYPVFEGDDNIKQQVFDIAARIKQRADEIESLTGAQDTDKAELKMFVLPFYFQVNRGRTEPPSSIAIPSAAGEVLVTFQNRYKKLADESALIPILGDQLEEYFRQAFSLKINGELLPVDRAQDIVNEIQGILERHHALDALEVSEEIKPVKTFHDQRHTVFTPEQNLALDAAAPIVAMIKTKGRGK